MSQTVIEVSSSKQLSFIDIALSYFQYFLDMLVNAWNCIWLYFAAQVEHASESLNQVAQQTEAVTELKNDINQLTKDADKVLDDTTQKAKDFFSNVSVVSIFPPVIQPVNDSQTNAAQPSASK